MWLDNFVNMASLLARGLYPEAATLQAWETCEEARAWSQATVEHWNAVMGALGLPDGGPAMLIAATPPHLLIAALETWAQAGAPNTMAKVRVALALNGLRVKFGMEPVDLLPPPGGVGPVAPAAPAAPGQPVGNVAVPAVKVKLSQTVDQGSDQEVPMLPAGDLVVMRRRFLAIYGDPPLHHAEVTDAQLTGLMFKITSGASPYADFGVWGPYGARIERRMKFTSHVTTPDGTWRTVELPGADCLDTWRECWAVFKTAAVMCNLAHPATLDRYEQLFAERCKRYPGAWHLCAQADIRCRSECWVDEKRVQEQFHTQFPQLSAFDPAMPWNTVIKKAAGDAEFWDKELDKPALLYMLGRGRTHPSTVERAPPAAAGEPATKRRKRQHGSNGGGTGAGPGSGHPGGGSGHAEPRQRPGREANKGNGKGPHPRTNRSGRYFTDRSGGEICFTWNRKADGCSDAGCPQRRSHVCERCLQPHRAVHCPRGAPPHA